MFSWPIYEDSSKSYFTSFYFNVASTLDFFQVEIFVNRMKSNSSRGRPIYNDSSVQNLFQNAVVMHSKLLTHIQEQEDLRIRFEELQDKITQVRFRIHPPALT